MKDRHGAKEPRGTAVVAAALVLVLVPTAGKATGCNQDVEAKTLKMEVVPERQRVAHGDSVDFRVTVTRGPDGDGEPRSPASDVRTLVVLESTSSQLAGAATTDDDGQARITIAVPDDVGRGWLDGDGFARLTHVSTPCGDVIETGKWVGERVVRIVR